jgi:hypothetical protein
MLAQPPQPNQRTICTPAQLLQKGCKLNLGFCNRNLPIFWAAATPTENNVKEIMVATTTRLLPKYPAVPGKSIDPKPIPDQAQISRAFALATYRYQ